MHLLQKGDKYRIPNYKDMPHEGHIVTVIEVNDDFYSLGPDPSPAGPSYVWVECECGSKWSFEDREGIPEEQMESRIS